MGQGTRVPAPAEYQDLDVRLYTRPKRRIYARWTDSRGTKRHRSTSTRDPTEAWRVVARWSDIPRTVPSPNRPAVSVPPPTGAPHRTAPHRAIVQPQPQLPAVRSRVVPTDRRAWLSCAVRCYVERCGRAPTAGEESFWVQEGRWPLPAELTAWSRRQPSTWWLWVVAFAGVALGWGKADE